MEATVCRAVSLGLTAPHFAEITGYRGGALGPFTSSRCHVGQRWACRVVVLSNCRPMGNYDYLLAALGRIIDHLYLWFVGVIIQITCVCSYSKPEYHQLSYFACKTVSPTVKKSHPECTKSHRFELKNQKKIGRGTETPPPLGRVTPLPQSSPTSPSHLFYNSITDFLASF